MSCKVISFGNLKGGVGKSTLAITLTEILRENNRVLFIDLDINGSASFHFESKTKKECRLDALTSITDTNHILNANQENEIEIEILTSDFELVNQHNIHIDTISILTDKIKDKYDFIIIDTPSWFNNLIISAYKASDMIILPAVPDLNSKRTCLYLLEQIEALDIKAVIGILLNQYSKTKKEFENEKANIFYSDQILKEYLLETTIPKSKSIERALLEENYKFRGIARKAFNRLIEEITGAGE